MNRMHIEQTLINKIIDNLPEQLKLILEPYALTYGKNNSQLYDGCLNLEVSETGCYQFYFDVKLNLRKEILIKWLRSHSNEDCLLITDVLTPNLQQYCIENSINFIDSAGNLFIQRPGLFLLIRGQKSTVRLKQTNTLSIGIMKLLFVILADKELINHSYREIAEMANISLGMVSKEFSYLKNNHLYRESSTGRCLTSPDELYTQWIQNYATILRPKFKILTLSDDIDWQTILLHDGEYWGGRSRGLSINA